mgnify:CR=1 FL=1
MNIPENLIYIDIETVSQCENYSELTQNFKSIWEKKQSKDPQLHDLLPEEAYRQKAAIFAEFGKIVCISLAFYDKSKEEYRMKSFFAYDEKQLLADFADFCAQLKKKYLFCGHNIREFDIPYISRRFLINALPIPPILDFQNKKPWEIEMIDTLQLWKFGDYKNFTSLETLATIFDIPTPKDDIDGSQVGHVYWVEKDLNRIVTYCQHDVIAIIQLLRKLSQKPIVPLDKIKIIPNE